MDLRKGLGDKRGCMRSSLDKNCTLGLQDRTAEDFSVLSSSLEKTGIPESGRPTMMKGC